MSKKKRRPADETITTTRHYDMPFSALPPKLINPELGLPNLVSRAAVDACYTMDVTLLDTPDHRLLRAGVLLAHRVLGGRGEWYLGGGGWVPSLPEEQIEPMGQADLPPGYADLVMPFRRRGTLGPVAALNCERREFAFKNTDGASVALLRDDRVSVSRGGLITARYREATLTPVGAGLTPAQADWIDHAITSAGATREEAFPGLAARLGAPATGQTDYPAPRRIEAKMPFASFVSALVNTRLHEIVLADLAVRSGAEGAPHRLARAAGSLADELSGLSPAFDPSWLEDLDEELEWVAEQAAAVQLGVAPPVERFGALRTGRGEDLAEGGPGRLTVVLRRERYLNLLERLVTAGRAPRLGESSEIETGDVLETLLESALSRFSTIADRLRVDGADADWSAAASAAAELRLVTGVVGEVLGKTSHRVQRRVDPALSRLDECVRAAAEAEQLTLGLDEVEVTAAFERGRRYEALLGELRAARNKFCAAWAKAARKLDR